MGDWPQYIYVVDLATNSVRPIPDYYSDYELYAANSYPFFDSILGWFDNERFAIRDRNLEMITAAKDGRYFKRQPFPELGPFNHPYMLELLPDRNTLFAWTPQGFYVRDASTGVKRKVGDLPPGGHFSPIAPSPDGSQVSLMQSIVEIEDNARVKSASYSLWVQHLRTGENRLISEIKPDAREWVWSPDSTRIAFTVAEPAPPDERPIYSD